MKPSDLTGHQFGQLTAISQVESTKDGKARWICRCACGATHEVRAYDLRSGRSTRCLACAKCSGKLADGIGGFRVLKRLYLRSARNRSLEFALTDEQFRSLTSSNCHYCGAAPNRVAKWNRRGSNRTAYLYNGIDRVDNDKGYLPDNCVPCCRNCNFFRQNMTVDAFLTHALQIASHQQNKET